MQKGKCEVDHEEVYRRNVSFNLITIGSLPWFDRGSSFGQARDKTEEKTKVKTGNPACVYHHVIAIHICSEIVVSWLR